MMFSFGLNNPPLIDTSALFMRLRRGNPPSLPFGCSRKARIQVSFPFLHRPTRNRSSSFIWKNKCVFSPRRDLSASSSPPPLLLGSAVADFFATFPPPPLSSSYLQAGRRRLRGRFPPSPKISHYKTVDFCSFRPLSPSPLFSFSCLSGREPHRRLAGFLCFCA